MPRNIPHEFWRDESEMGSQRKRDQWSDQDKCRSWPPSDWLLHAGECQPPIKSDRRSNAGESQLSIKFDLPFILGESKLSIRSDPPFHAFHAGEYQPPMKLDRLFDAREQGLRNRTNRQDDASDFKPLFAATNLHHKSSEGLSPFELPLAAPEIAPSLWTLDQVGSSNCCAAASRGGSRRKDHSRRDPASDLRSTFYSGNDSFLFLDYPSPNPNLMPVTQGNFVTPDLGTLEGLLTTHDFVKALGSLSHAPESDTIMLSTNTCFNLPRTQINCTRELINNEYSWQAGLDREHLGLWVPCVLETQIHQPMDGLGHGVYVHPAVPASEDALSMHRQVTGIGGTEVDVQNITDIERGLDLGVKAVSGAAVCFRLISNYERFRERGQSEWKAAANAFGMWGTQWLAGGAAGLVLGMIYPALGPLAWVIGRIVGSICVRLPDQKMDRRIAASRRKAVFVTRLDTRPESHNPTLYYGTIPDARLAHQAGFPCVGQFVPRSSSLVSPITPVNVYTPYYFLAGQPSDRLATLPAGSFFVPQVNAIGFPSDGGELMEVFVQYGHG